MMTKENNIRLKMIGKIREKWWFRYTLGKEELTIHYELPWVPTRCLGRPSLTEE